jgi:uncharacterized protein with ParB-like and HNH nuclease domain
MEINLMESNVLENPKDYSLKELFSGDRRIVITDFQRDYCWGDSVHGEKADTDIVSGFLDTLIEESDNPDCETILGKIDVYEDPANYINLTDGQQRLTTLFLLLGMLCRYGNKEKILKCLTVDDNELRLQYAIRESTVYFLRDLTNYFFKEGNTLSVDKIRDEYWYFSEYDNDPSIISMIKALKTIDGRLHNNDLKNRLEKFTQFILDTIKIQYYDVGDRKHGEERFVIINTTGKYLTTSENVKPVLLSKLQNASEFAGQWEDRETWFWKQKEKEEKIADDGVLDFLIWCIRIIDRKESVDLIKDARNISKGGTAEKYLRRIDKLFRSMNVLIDYMDKDRNIKRQFDFIDENKKDNKGILRFRALSEVQRNNALLPLLAFIEKISDEPRDVYKFLRRLRKNYFDYILGVDKKFKVRGDNYLDWRCVLEIIEKCGTLDEVLVFSEKGSVSSFQSNQ